MKNKIIVVSVFIMVIVVSMLLFCNNNNKMVKDGITYALTIDGIKQNSFPAKGVYKVQTECENAVCTWDYENWYLRVKEITDFSGKVTCNVNFTTINKVKLSDYIISIEGTTQGVGQVVHETFTNSSGILVDTGYRYEGKNPNNYVWFNNELWRIIGVFDESTHEQNGQNLVKIVRENSIGAFSWDISNSNDWSKSSLKRILNPIEGDADSGPYYYRKNGTGNKYCYGYYSETITIMPSNCDFSYTGINLYYRNMIKNVIWKIGGNTKSGGTASEMYSAERGTYARSGNEITTDGYIGLIYVSDYAYSVLSDSCERTISLNAYNTVECAGQSWMLSLTASLLNHFTLRAGMLLSTYNGYTTTTTADAGHSINPALYLNENVYVLDGNGSITDPYIIGMDEV